MLVAPARARSGDIVGVVQVVNAEQGHFSPDDEARMRVLCAEAATAIESPSLFEELTGRPGDVAPLKER